MRRLPLSHTSTSRRVSIHAPARGATSAHSVQKLCKVFQSTHPHGVRLTKHHFNQQKYGFNPRTRTGCDVSIREDADNKHCFNPRTRTGCDDLTCVYPHKYVVSIHAPARGATAGRTFTCPRVSVSIHAPARGATSLCIFVSKTKRFQSTHPHGVRLKITNSKNQQKWFQSTHPHGVRRTFKRLL